MRRTNARHRPGGAGISSLKPHVDSGMQTPEVRERLIRQGIDADPGTPDELTRLVQAERAHFTKLIKLIGLKPD